MIVASFGRIRPFLAKIMELARHGGGAQSGGCIHTET